MDDCLDEQDYKGYSIKIYQDQDPPNPRNFDHLGTMICIHPRYKLGDEHDLSPEDIMELTKDKNVVWK